MNVFGLTRPEMTPVKGGFLGRAFLVQEQPAQWVQASIQRSDNPLHQPVMTTTNEKGGFYLGNLEPGRYELYVVSRTGQAAKKLVTIGKGQLVENDHIQLSPSPWHDAGL